MSTRTLFSSQVVEIILVAAGSTLLHLLFGWWLSPLASLIGGFATQNRGSMIGAAGLVFSWSGLLIFNLVVAFDQVREMTRVMGDLLGGAPGSMILISTVFVAALLGAVSGALGQNVRLLAA